jgi:hypothetical protein
VSDFREGTQELEVGELHSVGSQGDIWMAVDEFGDLPVLTICQRVRKLDYSFTAERLQHRPVQR